MSGESNINAPTQPGPHEQNNETLLLLTMLDLAMTNIDVAISLLGKQDKEAASRCLTKAVDTYGSVKNILPKLDLQPQQAELVRERLDLVRQRLWSGPVNIV